MIGEELGLPEELQRDPDSAPPRRPWRLWLALGIALALLVAVIAL